MATQIRLEIREKVAYINIFEEIERHPCTLDWESLKMLDEAIEQIAARKELRAAVVQSLSPKSFVVGANINALKELDAENIADWVRNGHQIFGKLQRLPIPVIARVEHYALGGGLELAMACDFIVASTQARFAQPEASLGVMPGWGGSYKLANLIGPARAKEMFFTGAQIDAQQAYEWGLVNHVCAPEQLDEVIDGILAGIISNDARVLHLTKEIVNSHCLSQLDRSEYEEANTSSACMSSESTKNRLSAFFNNRK